MLIAEQYDQKKKRKNEKILASPKEEGSYPNSYVFLTVMFM